MIIPERTFATRLNSFRGTGARARTVDEAITAVAAVPGISAIELNYPQHLPSGSEASLLTHARSAGLNVTALNLRFDGPEFDLGAFTHPDARSRERAIDIAMSAVALAGAECVPHVILWMGPDGYDYPFQADYAALWELEVDGFRRVASHGPDVRVSVEYKPSDPRRTSLIRSMSDSLLAVRDVGCANFGVTLDFCHALMAGEHPAAAAALAMREGKLFGIHLNDGYGPADDGLMVGSVHPWQTLDLLWHLRTSGFTGTIYFDTFPDRVDPAAECAANIRTVRLLERVLDRIEPETIGRMQRNQDALGVSGLLQAIALGDDRG